MGLLSIITRNKFNGSTEKGGAIANGKGGDLANGGHNLDTNRVLATTDNAVPTPQNADFSSIRTAPVVAKPRYFTKAEAQALQALAKEKQIQAEASKVAYRSLKNIDSSDVEVHTTHRRYQSRLAKNEVEKQQSNAQLAKDLHGLRPHYAETRSQVEIASQAAANAINAIKNSYGC